MLVSYVYCSGTWKLPPDNRSKFNGQQTHKGNGGMPTLRRSALFGMSRMGRRARSNSAKRNRPDLIPFGV